MSQSEILRLLVVDDEPDLEALIRQKFRKQIREGLAEFHFAYDGQDAVDKLRSDLEVDVVLTDINMPRMDGLTLLSHLPGCNPIMKAVVVSAYGDMENIRTAMNRGAFDFITKPINFQDLEVTIDKTFAFVQQQKATVKAIKENDILKMYVDQDVIRFMSGKKFEESLLSSETENATVLFVDICGYTAISEQYPANKVVSLLNRYFDKMVAEIVKNKGQVDKFMGDCVMAVFKGEHHPDNALEAAIAIRDEFDAIVEADMNDYKPKISIGVNSGDMISGNIGSETLKRLDYTVIGDVVNTSQRFQSAAEPSQIIIGEAMYGQIKDSFQCEEIGFVKLKNKAEPQKIYNVVG